MKMSSSNATATTTATTSTTAAAAATAAATASTAAEKFEEAQFLRDLVNLKETQEAISNFSSWCIRNRKAAYKIARCWLKVIKKVKVNQKLVLFYLFNDIVQNAKRKQAAEMLTKCQAVLKEAIPHLRDDKIAEKIQR